MPSYSVASPPETSGFAAAEYSGPLPGWTGGSSSVVTVKSIALRKGATITKSVFTLH